MVLVADCGRGFTSGEAQDLRRSTRVIKLVCASSMFFRSMCVYGLALTLAGCSGASLPPLANGAVTEPSGAAAGSSVASPPAKGAGAPASPGASVHAGNHDDGFIRRFRAASVVLYRTETGHEGQRVPTSFLSLPIRVNRRSADGSRFELMTVEGSRWIAFADVAGAPSSGRSNQR